MRDALGGVVNIQMILVFIAVISGYLAFSVSYTKAVHVKDFIINKLEEYEGYDDINTNIAGKTGVIRTAVSDYMNKIGYSGSGSTKSVNDSTCEGIIENLGAGGADVHPKLVSDPGISGDYIICRYDGAKKTVYNNETATYEQDKANRYYYVVVTYISIDIPVINQIMSNLRYFEISGKTKLIEDRSI